MALFRVFGAAPSGARLERIRQSSHYKDGQFQNPEPTRVTLKVSPLKMLREFNGKPADNVPQHVLPSVQSDLDLRKLPSESPVIVWFGHSSYLIRINGLHILVDPVFSGNASPVSFFAKAFPATYTYKAEDMPDIDVLLITHDHYDHLDYQTVVRLAKRTKRVVTSLGVGAHLEYWGFEAARITELDWGETATIGEEGMGEEGKGHPGISLTATAARHFSGRGLKRAGTLWSSFVLKSADHRLFLGGDSGYGNHFKSIGDEFGSFDLAILECGQYGQYWPYIHMLPEMTVRAAQDLRAEVLMPVHWGKFSLSVHSWDEPVRRIVKAAEAAGMRLITPKIGEVVRLGLDWPVDRWWEGIV